MRPCIAIVVPRCHARLVGGAEALAWQYAQLLAVDHEVEVLTSTAFDYTKWENDLDAGVEQRDGITIRRFTVARGRTPYFHALHRIMLDAFEKFEAPSASGQPRRYG
ncbi:MAG: hypothetical protein KDI81_17200, partial [Xanthomonadales bacterium]|nr:hypothetical protein [Xanthomonadales bacterium]